jgi:hypothetical protein
VLLDCCAIAGMTSPTARIEVIKNGCNLIPLLPSINADIWCLAYKNILSRSGLFGNRVTPDQKEGAGRALIFGLFWPKAAVILTGRARKAAHEVQDDPNRTRNSPAGSNSSIAAASARSRRNIGQCQQLHRNYGPGAGFPGKLARAGDPLQWRSTFSRNRPWECDWSASQPLGCMLHTDSGDPSRLRSGLAQAGLPQERSRR